MSQSFSRDQLNTWIDISLENEDIKDYNIDLTGSSEKGEGYTTDVIFVKVMGTKKSNEEDVVFNLVLKVGKDFKAMDKSQQDELYQREMFIYDVVFPEYRKFEQSKKCGDIFDCVPKCFKTFEESHVVVLENLRTQGYEPYDRLSPFNLFHLKMVLKNYAKFHATGFAFKDQNPTDYQNLTKNYTNAYKKMTKSALTPMFKIGAIKSRDLIKEVDASLAKKLDGIIEKDVVQVLDGLFLEDVEETVITHGDCWNSNFLFKYDNENKECPSRLAILDWQLSSLVSPMVDVGYFMFIVSSKDQVSKFDELLEYYYENLCQNISELGSDPTRLFPYSKFQEHWKMYCTLGYILSISILEMLLCDQSAAPDLAECSTEDELIKVTTYTAKNREMYLERILALSRYYFDLIEK